MRALQREIDQLLTWYQNTVDWRRPYKQEESSFETYLGRRERDLKAIQQHLLRLLSVREILQST